MSSSELVNVCVVAFTWRMDKKDVELTFPVYNLLLCVPPTCLFSVCP